MFRRSVTLAAALAVFPLFAQPVFVGVTLQPPGRRVDPGSPFTGFVEVIGATAGTQIAIALPGGGTLTAARLLLASGPVDCDVLSRQAVCTQPELPPGERLRIEVGGVAPERTTGGSVVLQAEVAGVTATAQTRLVRHLVVTNTNDEGAGSLRQALLESQTLCASAPCAVVFRVTQVPENGRIVFAPNSPLPEVRGWMKIDGATQRELNPGATVEIVGTNAGLAHGLLLGAGCEIQVLNLGIFGFQWPGIEAHRGPLTAGCRIEDLQVFPNTLIEDNTIGGNYRGIVIVDTQYSSVSRNVLAENRRAGLFVDRSHYVSVTRNTIVRNGASGIFFNAGSREYDAGGADVAENTISGNAEWGIARTHNGEISLNRNAIFDNVHMALDVGLDLATPNRERDDLTSVPNKPVLFSAHFDANANKTIVRGRIDTIGVVNAGTAIDLYASRKGHGELEQWVASKSYPGGDVHEDFTIGIDADLRGRFITATSTRSRIIGFAKPPGAGTDSHLSSVPADTSEVSDAVPVQ